MMENTKVNKMNNTETCIDSILRLQNAIYGIKDCVNKTTEVTDKFCESYKYKQWLEQLCPVIKQNDFDTCGGSYSDGNYDTCNGYRQAYNTYLDQFENC